MFRHKQKIKIQNKTRKRMVLQIFMLNYVSLPMHPGSICSPEIDRGVLHSLENAYEIFSEQKDLYGFLMDFS